MLPNIFQLVQILLSAVLILREKTHMSKIDLKWPNHRCPCIGLWALQLKDSSSKRNNGLKICKLAKTPILVGLPSLCCARGSKVMLLRCLLIWLCLRMEQPPERKNVVPGSDPKLLFAALCVWRKALPGKVMLLSSYSSLLHNCHPAVTHNYPELSRIIPPVKKQLSHPHPLKPTQHAHIEVDLKHPLPLDMLLHLQISCKEINIFFENIKNSRMAL